MTAVPRAAWRGTVDYERALHEQRARRQALLEGRAGPAFWVLEHPSVYTTGRRQGGTVTAAPTLRGVPVVRTERGGLMTWHGPGQLVGYLIVDLSSLGLGAHRLVTAVEAGLIAWLAGAGVTAGRRDGAHGVWVGDQKIAALGFHLRRGATMHGFSLNLCNDLGAFSRIVPCGIREGGVTSVATLLGGSPAPSSAAVEVGRAICRAVGLATVDTS